MRTSATLMNIAAAAAVALAVGSLWQAYKVRFASDDVVEQVAASEPAPTVAAVDPPAIAATAAAPAPVLESDAVVLPKPLQAAVPGSPSGPSGLGIPTAVAPAVAPGATPGIEVAQKTAPAPVPAKVGVSLRDSRGLSHLAPIKETATPGSAGEHRLPTALPLAAPPVAGPRLQDPRSLGPPSAATAASSVALGPAVGPLPATGCDKPGLETQSLEGGLMRLLVVSACRAGQHVQLAYGGAMLIRKLDGSGRLDFKLDCFAGTTSDLAVTFADGTREALPVSANDLGRVSKTAVIWNAPVNLDLHAFEYSASFGKDGHVWERAASNLATAREIARAGRRGRGFLSTTDDGRALGDKLEVYTFLHHDQQTSGGIAMGLDYETRGDLPNGSTCGTGPFAEIPYQVVVLGRGGQIARENGVLAAAACGVQIEPQVRFDPLQLPSLRVRR